MKAIFFICASMLPLAGFSQTDTALVRFSNPSSVAQVVGYSHAAEIDLGKSKMLLLSGQIALDSNGKLVGKYNLALQTEQIFTNIRNIVAASGGTMDDLVKITIFMKDISHVQIVRDVRNKYINLRHPPASTLVEVSRLVSEDLLVEIEATVVIAKK